MIKTNGISDLQQALEIVEGNKTRKCCGENQRLNTHYGPHLIIDVQLGLRKSTKFSDMPPCITVNENTQYQIAGLVTYQGTYDSTTVGHYVGYAVVGTNWLKYDDTSSSSTPDSINDHAIEIDPHLLLYTLLP